jgi:molybdopterin converting factor small subunit
VREFPDLERYERSISSAVNADYARMDDRVRDGDEIAFLPPVSGG